MTFSTRIHHAGLAIVPRHLRGALPAATAARPRHAAMRMRPCRAVEDAMACAQVAGLDASNFHTFLDENKDKSLLVVDFYTQFCGPCKVMSTVIEDMACEFSDVSFGKFDCSGDPASKRLAFRSGVKALPTFHLYRGSQKVGELTGAKAADLKVLVRQHLETANA